MTRDLLVSEIFGPTFQGEGRSVGQICTFVRLGTCNLHCTWCDTPYTWAFDERHAQMHVDKKQYDPKVEMQRMSPQEAHTQLAEVANGVKFVVISGGEPMLQQEGIADLIYRMPSYHFEIETAGTRKIEDCLGPYVTDVEYGESQLKFNVSPKLEHSGNTLAERRNWEALEDLASCEPTIFKFVVTATTWHNDIVEIKEIQKELKLDSSRIWIMPIGIRKQEQLHSMEYFAPLVLEQGWNMTPRLHTLIWGNERGR
jgi:7-carboxy-7-deazaguanine synthase